MLLRNRQMALKIESVEGTPETIAAVDADLLIYDPKFNPNVNYFQRRPARGSMTSFPGVSGIRTGEIAGRVEARGSGVPGTAPSWGKLLRVCGFKQTATKKLTIGAIAGGPFTHGEVVTGASSGATGRVMGEWANGAAAIYVLVTAGIFVAEGLTGASSGATATASAVASEGFAWEPTSVEADIPSGTAAVMDDGVKKFIAGARGTLSFSATAGEPGFFEFSLMGPAEDWADVALLAPTYETTEPPVFLSAGFTLGSYAALIRSLTFDMANVLAPRTDVNKASGMRSYRISDRNPVGTLDPEQTVMATYDWWSILKAGTTQKIHWLFDGGSAGNRIKIMIPEAQIQELGDEERDGMATHGLSYQMVGDSNKDQEIAILMY